MKKNYYDELSDELSKMYSEKYFCCNGVCKFYSECSKKQNLENISFRQDRVKLGKNYGNGVPRILFVGIEGLHYGSTDLDSNLIVNRISNPAGKEAVNPHYNGVKYILGYLLASEHNNTNKVGKNICSEYDKYTDRFALTNFYKCAFPKQKKQVSGLPHKKAMQQYCQQILIDEIKILEPEIIIIQAANWPKNLWDNLRREFNFDDESIYGDWDKDRIALYRSSQSKNSVFLLSTYHGACRKFKSIKYITKVNKALDLIIEKMQTNTSL